MKLIVKIFLCWSIFVGVVLMLKMIFPYDYRDIIQYVIGLAVIIFIIVKFPPFIYMVLIAGGIPIYLKFGTMAACVYGAVVILLSIIIIPIIISRKKAKHKAWEKAYYEEHKDEIEREAEKKRYLEQKEREKQQATDLEREKAIDSIIYDAEHIFIFVPTIGKWITDKNGDFRYYYERSKEENIPVCFNYDYGKFIDSNSSATTNHKIDSRIKELFNVIVCVNKESHSSMMPIATTSNGTTIYTSDGGRDTEYYTVTGVILKRKTFTKW